ncbi:RHS repeat-associated core domain-containing protein [Vibrio campbellii]|nr:colicin D domain-containing protein [Vibrio campbellii]
MSNNKYPSVVPFIFVSIAALFFMLPAHALTSSDGKKIALSGEYITSGGEATYTLPIKVIRGRSSHQPELSFDYQSDGANGALGLGWSLGGSSFIHRCGKNIETDGNWGGVRFDSNDRYCVDGERLIAVKGSDGEDLTEYRIKKNGYDKIVSFGGEGTSGPQYFKVWRTDGSVYEYGSTSDSRVELPNQKHVYKWALSKITDSSKNNSIQYHYHESSASGTHYLSSITYVGGRIVFGYENRIDIISQYLYGERLTRNQRLNSVSLYDELDRKVSEYILKYKYSSISNRSLIEKIEYCSQDNMCSTPITFSWYEDSDIYEREKDNVDFLDVSFFDVERDGIKELYGSKIRPRNKICRINPGDSNTSPSLMKSPTGVELKGTGEYTLFGSLDAPEMIAQQYSYKESEEYCYNHVAYGRKNYDVIKLGSKYSSYLPELNGQLVKFKQPDDGYKLPADLNGDGKQTLISENGSMLEGPIDIDNDGKDDYFSRSYNKMKFYLSSRNHVPFFHQFKKGIGINDYHVGDINNDGYADFLIKEALSNGTQSKLYVYFFNGVDFYKESERTFNNGNKDDFHKINLVDINSDGYPDLYINDKFYRNEFGKINYDLIIGSEIKNLSKVLDINGDGHVDLLTNKYNKDTEDNTLYVYKSKSYPLDKISMIKENHVEYSVYYKPASDNSVLSQERYFNYPILNATPSRYLVSSFKIKAKGYKTINYSYSYSGAKYHYLGGGFLGFSTITEVEDADVVTTKVNSYYQLDLKTAGELKGIDVYKQNEGADAFSYSDVDKVSSTSYQYKTNTTGKTYQVYADSIVQSQYEKGTLLKTSTTSRTLNKFGGVTREETTIVNEKNKADTFTSLTEKQYQSTGYSTTKHVIHTITSSSISDMATKLSAYQDGLTAYCSTSGSSVYFKPNDKFVLIHGEVDTPILVTKHNEYYRFDSSNSDINDFNGITHKNGTLVQITPSDFDRQSLVACGHYTYGNFTGDSSPELSTTSSSITQLITETGKSYWKVGAVKQSTTTITDNQSGLSKNTVLDYGYTSNGLLASVKTSGGAYEAGSVSGRYLTTAYRYDGWGNLLSEIQSGSDLATRTTSHTYDSRGLNLKTSSNAKGHTTTWHYDSQGRLKSSISPLKGRTTSYDYDAFGRVEKETLPGSGNINSNVYQLANECTNALDTTASCVSAKSATGSDVVTHYDYAGREVRQLHRAFDGKWVVVDTSWDRNGRKLSVTRPHFLSATTSAPKVTFEYDLLDRETRKVEPANRGSLALFTTNYDGYKTEVTDARGYKHSTTHNVQGHIIRKDEPLGAYQTYAYYPDGKLKTTIDAVGNATSIKYDNLGHRTQLDDPDLGLWNYRYNAIGELVYKRDANSVTTTIDYDTLGRKTKQVEGGDTSHWRYDERGALGTLSWFSGKGQRTDYFYNSKGLLFEKAVTVGSEIFTTQYGYDNFERVGREVRPDGQTISSALEKPDNNRLAVEFIYNQYGYMSAVRSPKTYADDVFTSAKFREDIRQLLNEAINQANEYLKKASRYATQTSFFEQKVNEYKNKTVDVYNLDDYSASLLSGEHRYKQWCDSQGNCYLRPATWVLLHDDVTIPLDITLEGAIYQLNSSLKNTSNGIRKHSLTASTISENEFNNLALSQTEDFLLSGDYDGNGQPDMMHQGDIYSAKADGRAREELLFAAEDLEQAAKLANSYYKLYTDLAANMIGLSEKVAELSGLYCEYANALGGDHVNASLRNQCADDGSVSQADHLETILTNSELAKLSGNNAYIYYWQRRDTDAYDHTLAETLGNGLVNTYEHDTRTGRPSVIATHKGSQVFNSGIASSTASKRNIRYLGYQYDNHNNVTQRYDDQLGITDIWTYDDLDRVKTNTIVLADKTQHGLNNPDLASGRTYGYDKLGNITYKSGIGSYQYSGINAGPHAVTKANGLNYGYDAVGNMLRAYSDNSTASERSIEWSVFNKPTKIVRNGKTVEFSYDANHQRYLKKSSDGTETFYFGNTYERVKNTHTGELQHKHFIFADGKLIALNTQTTDTNNKLKDKQIRYLHYDALNSVDMVTDGYGLVVERRSYDTWGMQRNIVWQNGGAAEVIQEAITNRGYTGHEEIAEVGLIHMNGRVYDQELGRFLSADSFVQTPYVVNSFNRYAYVINNPLKYTDPTGYWYADGDGNGLTGLCGEGWSYDGLSGRYSGNGRSNNYVRSHDIGYETYGQKQGLSEKSSLVSDMGSKIHARLTLSYGSIENIEGNVYVGALQYQVNNFSLGVIYGDISSEQSLNADPVVRANIEAFEESVGLLKYAVVPPSGKIKSLGGLANDIVTFSTKQLDKKFKHAKDFGLETTKKNPSTLAQFEQALRMHLADPNTVNRGTYGLVKDSSVHFNSKTNIALVTDSKGNFVTGFKVSPNSAQFNNYVKNGVLR